MLLNRLYLTKKENVFSVLQGDIFSSIIFVPKEEILLLIEISSDLYIFYYNGRLITYNKRKNEYYLNYLLDITID